MATTKKKRRPSSPAPRTVWLEMGWGRISCLPLPDGSYRACVVDEAGECVDAPSEVQRMVDAATKKTTAPVAAPETPASPTRGG